jgi:hypothetical protein
LSLCNFILNAQARYAGAIPSAQKADLGRLHFQDSLENFRPAQAKVSKTLSQKKSHMCWCMSYPCYAGRAGRRIMFWCKPGKKHKNLFEK